MTNGMFEVVFDKRSGGILAIRNVKDEFEMNWCQGDNVWGTLKDMDLVSCEDSKDGFVSVYSDEKLEVTVRRYFNSRGNFCESYTFKNIIEEDVFVKRGDIGIYATFNDDCLTLEECLQQRCHTHIWCGDNVSYVNALKKGDSPINLGLIVVSGGLSGYSIERNFKHHSNDRGDFILHPTPFSLRNGESYTLAWELFWHTGVEDFYRHCREYLNFVFFEVPQYSVFYGERIIIKAHISREAKEVRIHCDEEYIPYVLEDNIIKIEYLTKRLGEHEFVFYIDDIRTFVKVNCLLPMQSLLGLRANFIVEKQQFHKEGSYLDGAYLIYDNEDKCLYFDALTTDHNASRERLGMGIFLAKYLQLYPDEKIMSSLNKYEIFVKREFFDEKTGAVYDTIRKRNSKIRLYNAPWMATFWMEMFQLKKNDYYLDLMYRTLLYYYQTGGKNFYPNGLPMEESVRLLAENNKKEETLNLLSMYRNHVNVIIKNGLDYPKHEVNFEQTIVTPAVLYLTQMYKLTGEEQYQREAKKHIKILERFNGEQPDYHMHEIPIRHWDDYWFGKRKLLGDTFPHYWSCLSAAAFKHYSDITGDKKYLEKAVKTIRGSLCLFNKDGSASCAYVYPYRINNHRGEFYDEWANDQDFALYFALRLGIFT